MDAELTFGNTINIYVCYEFHDFWGMSSSQNHRKPRSLFKIPTAYAIENGWRKPFLVRNLKKVRWGMNLVRAWLWIWTRTAIF